MERTIAVGELNGTIITCVLSTVVGAIVEVTVEVVIRVGVPVGVDKAVNVLEGRSIGVRVVTTVGVVVPVSTKE